MRVNISSLMRTAASRERETERASCASTPAPSTFEHDYDFKDEIRTMTHLPEVRLSTKDVSFILSGLDFSLKCCDDVLQFKGTNTVKESHQNWFCLRVLITRIKSAPLDCHSHGNHLKSSPIDITGPSALHGPLREHLLPFSSNCLPGVATSHHPQSK